jgi:hypothetical protein
MAGVTPGVEGALRHWFDPAPAGNRVQADGGASSQPLAPSSSHSYAAPERASVGEFSFEARGVIRDDASRSGAAENTRNERIGPLCRER